MEWFKKIFSFFAKLAFAAKKTISAMEDNACKDSNGEVLQNGDMVKVIKSLKVKGSSLIIESGHGHQERPAYFRYRGSGM
jgi:uncharacterized Zn ribbon protein